MYEERLKGIMKRLQVTDSTGRHKTIEELEALVSEALPLLDEVLNDPDGCTGWLTAQSLEGKSDPDVLAALRVALSDDEPLARACASKTIGELGLEEAIPDLLGMLNDTDVNVQTAALGALARLGERTFPKLLDDRLHSKSVAVQYATANALDVFQYPEILTLLLGYLADTSRVSSIFGDKTVAEVAIRAIVRHGDAALPRLVEYLSSPDVILRKNAVRCLGDMGKKDNIPILLGRLRDDIADVRIAVIGALEQTHDTSMIPHVISMLNDDEVGAEGYSVAHAAWGVLREYDTPEALAAVEAWESKQKSKDIAMTKEHSIQDRQIGEHLFIELLNGFAPIQGFGTVMGIEFYFRARYDEWQFHVSLNPDIDMADIEECREGYFFLEGPYAKASHMSLEKAVEIIQDCAEKFIEWQQMRETNI